MTREQLEAFAKKHLVLIVGTTVGIGVIIYIVVKRGQSSSNQSKATLDTIHSDLQQVDFDINQVNTNLDVFGNPFASTTGAQSTGMPGPPTGPTPATSPALSSLSTQELEALDNNLNTEYTGQNIANVPAAVALNAQLDTILTQRGVPASQLSSGDFTTPVTSGTGGPGNTYTSLVENAWAFVNAGDYADLFTNQHSNTYAIVGDDRDYNGLN